MVRYPRAQGCIEGLSMIPVRLLLARRAGLAVLAGRRARRSSPSTLPSTL